MNEVIEKSAEQIKTQMEFWYLRFYGKSKPDINGKELFTLFDLIPESQQNKLIKQLDLVKPEIPVLILRISDSEFIVNTTDRFVMIDGVKKESIRYGDFEWHEGFIHFIMVNNEKVNVKKKGHFADFKIRKKDGERITRKIPTGEPGFAFWNVTKKCKLIGIKYKVTV